MVVVCLVEEGGDKEQKSKHILKLDLIAFAKGPDMEEEEKREGTKDNF